MADDRYDYMLQPAEGIVVISRASERHLGDLPGHPFRGNQWTETQGATLEAWLSSNPDEYAAMRDPSTAAGQKMTTLLNEMPDYTGPAYRGVMLDDEELERLTSEKTHKVSLHSSASQDEEAALNFMDQGQGGNPVLMEMHGTAAEITGAAEELGLPEAGELEVVVRAGTKYRFVKRVDEEGYTRVILKETR